MKKEFKTRTVLFSVLFLMTGIAAWGQGAKIGFVNSQEVLYGTEEGRKGLEDLEQFSAGKQQEFDAKSGQLNTLQQDFQAKQRTLNADALAGMQQQIEELQLELRRFQEDAQAAFNQRQNRLLQTISGKVQKVIEEYAETNSYLAIFLRDQTQAYVSPSLDVTQEIIKIYNEQNPVEGAPASAPAQPQAPGE